MPQDRAPKRTELKRADTRIRTRADLMAILWRDKRDIRMLTNICGGCHRLAHPLSQGIASPPHTAVVKASRERWGPRQQLSGSGGSVTRTVGCERSMRAEASSSGPGQ